jgi:hypothetical protein
MILRATHTHLYPGHRGTIAGLTDLIDLPSDGDCLVEFSDGSVTPARITPSANHWQLETGAYTTAAGTAIAEKRWLVDLSESEDRVEFRIVRKAPAHTPL